jgi:hypothetical protein
VTIVTSSYRPKRAPRKKRPQPPIANRIVTSAPMKPLKGPVILLGQQAPAEARPQRSAIVEPNRTSVFGNAPDMTEEELQRRGDAADALFRELVRRATVGERN